jgi:alpha-glucosidase (family GH31 glycosyl hydrolase)
VSAKLTRRNTPSIFGNDKTTLTFSAINIDDNHLEITFLSSSSLKQKNLHSQQFEDRVRSRIDTAAASNPQYSVQVQSQPFGVKVIRKSTNQAIFDTTGIPGFTFEDQYLSITTRTASANVYGFGEQVHQSLRQDMNWHKWGMFARDEPSSGSTSNLYGVHPFYICVENDGSTHGIFLYNTHAQNVELAPYPSVTYRTIGGSLVFHLFLGPTPEDVMRQYHQVIGLPHMPPYWSLGFHLCRYGYPNSAAVQTVWKRNQQAGIPQDAQWIDIDYMNSKMDFTYDQVNFNTLPQLAQTLHSSTYKLVLILDPAIASRPTISYQALNDGLAAGIFILDARTHQPIEGQVWPGSTYFPDFTNPNATAWWTKQAQSLHNLVSFDGLWIDMNEPSSFNAGSATGCDNNKWNNPPFVPLEDGLIYDKTICMDAIQYAGIHYDLHSLYGYYESISTRSALETIFPGKSPFVLTRSTFPGSETYAAHWTGDNNSQWSDMLWSIIASIEFNIFGIPFVGADICGFNGSSDEELCTRWMQLGAFYPFSRNHNSIGQPDQDPAVWSPNSIQSSKNALTVRYTLLPHLYTLLENAHKNGSTVMRPLFFEFNTDQNTYGINDQFLWGSGFMVAPIVTQGATSRSAYFPASRWYFYSSGSEIKSPTVGRTVTLNIGLYDLPGLFVRGGTIIPWQTASQTTVQSRSNSMGLLVALDENQASTGSLYWDDGETLDADKKSASYVTFNFNATYRGSQYGVLTIQKSSGNYVDTVALDTVQVYGLLQKPLSVAVNGATTGFQYDSANNAMTLSSLKLKIFSTSSNQIQWNYI